MWKSGMTGIRWLRVLTLRKRVEIYIHTYIHVHTYNIHVSVVKKCIGREMYLVKLCVTLESVLTNNRTTLNSSKSIYGMMTFLHDSRGMQSAVMECYTGICPEKHQTQQSTCPRIHSRNVCRNRISFEEQVDQQHWNHDVSKQMPDREMC